MENKEEVINDMPKKFSVLAIVSFVFALVGIAFAGLPCGLTATITSIIGIVKYKEDKQKGRWMAITGLVIGILEVIVMSLYIFMVAFGITTVV